MPECGRKNESKHERVGACKPQFYWVSISGKEVLQDEGFHHALLVSVAAVNLYFE